MSVNLTIIGLGQIGTSVGLALAEQKDQIKRIGHDKEALAAQKAQRLGAIDRIHYNLPAAVREADIVLLALPLNSVRETFEYIARELKEDALVLDTAPVKSAVAGWARDLLPARRHYIGLVPAINPAYLHEAGYGAEAAHADLFQKGLIGIVSTPGTSGEAMQLTVDLVQLLGAQPFFVDLAESDGLMAYVHLLPQLAAVALLNATVNEPGWAEARKLAGRAYAGVTAPTVYQDRAAGLQEAALRNRENVVRGMDGLIASLQGLRDDIAKEDEGSLTRRLENAYNGRLEWQNEREGTTPKPSDSKISGLPTPSQFLAQMFFGNKLLDRKKK